MSEPDGGQGYRERMQAWDDRHRGLHEREWNGQTARPGDPVDGFASSLGCAAALVLLCAPVVLLGIAGMAILQTLGRYGPELEGLVTWLGAVEAPARAGGITAGMTLLLVLLLLIVRSVLVRGWLRDPRAGRGALLLAVVPATTGIVVLLVVGLTAAAALALVAAGQGPQDSGGDPAPTWAWIAAAAGVLGWTAWFSLRAMRRATLRATR